MKKVIGGLLVVVLLLSGMAVVNKVATNQQEKATVSEEEEEVSYMGDPNLQLHYFRDDHYPTAEEAATWHIHRGQFPLENKERKVKLYNWNEN